MVQIILTVILILFNITAFAYESRDGSIIFALPRIANDLNELEFNGATLRKRSQSQAVEIGCPIFSSDDGPAADPVNGTTDPADPCGGPKKRGFSFPCICFKKPKPSKPQATSTVAAVAVATEAAQTDYQCLKQVEYPLVNLLEEPFPATSIQFVEYMPKLTGIDVTLAFYSLYSKIELLGRGAEAPVFKIQSFDSNDFNRALKSSPRFMPDIHPGIILTEKLVKTGKSDAFMRVYDYFHCDFDSILYRGIQAAETPSDACMITELMQGETVNAAIKSLAQSDGALIQNLVRSTVFQVLVALKIGRDTVDFYHGDLHSLNVMFDKIIDPAAMQNGRELFTYSVDGINYKVPKSDTGGARIKIIDYGKAIVSFSIYRNSDVLNFLRWVETALLTAELPIDTEFFEILRQIANANDNVKDMFSLLIGSDVFEVYR